MAIFLLGAVRALKQYPRVSLATGSTVGIGFGLRSAPHHGRVRTDRRARGRGLIFTVEARAAGIARPPCGGHFLLALPPFMRAGLRRDGADLAVVRGRSAQPFAPLNTSPIFEKPWQELFEGHLVSVPDMPRLRANAIRAQAAGDPVGPGIRRRGERLLAAFAEVAPSTGAVFS